MVSPKSTTCKLIASYGLIPPPPSTNRIRKTYSIGFSVVRAKCVVKCRCDNQCQYRCLPVRLVTSEFGTSGQRPFASHLSYGIRYCAFFIRHSSFFPLSVQCGICNYYGLWSTFYECLSPKSEASPTSRPFSLGSPKSETLLEGLFQS